MNELLNRRTPGNLISLRGREWIILPCDDPELLKVKPLGGSDDEATAIYLPLGSEKDKVKDAHFPSPTNEDLDDFESAKLLYHATKLSFRNVSGAFRCMGKLSFRPRSYQIVPLVMALKQETVRLLIADDVGVGKTIEALLILRELIERGEIKRFAVICLPHLCEQWYNELKDKLDIEAVVIRSGTVSKLERALPDDRSVFQHYPYQVISIDYLKAEKKKSLFLPSCPEFIIVDEAHTCARPAGATTVSQQQRYHLLYDISKLDKHLLLLTATPHSGKDDEFKSILGLLNQDFEKLDLQKTDPNLKKKIAEYFIQRKRENIERWLNEKTPFPKRETREIQYDLTTDYKNFYNEVIDFARKLSDTSKAREGSKMRYWAALALLRGVMSSPAAGMQMLQNRANKEIEEVSLQEDNYSSNPVIESIENTGDLEETELIVSSKLSSGEKKLVSELRNKIELLQGCAKDNKLEQTKVICKEWINSGFKPVIFCRYIATAKYVANHLKKELGSDIDIQAITSELTDDERREKIELMGNSAKRLMVATDCLSEGINLQDRFNAVLHYDLPWNPNRLEQREGRIDRFGQTAPLVKTYIIWGADNPVDAVVFKVLVEKVRHIRKTIGVSISIAEDNKSIMDAVLNQVLIHGKISKEDAVQQSLWELEDIKKNDLLISKQLEEATERGKAIRSIFAHETIKPEEIEHDLKEVDELIGNPEEVEEFVLKAVVHLNAGITKTSKGFQLNALNLPEYLKRLVTQKDKANISFESPTPEGYQYLGRNHKFVEQLCQMVFSLAFEKKGLYRKVARASVIQTKEVNVRTTLVQFRVRNVIREAGSKHEMISEEMYLWGFEGSPKDANYLDYNKAKQLLQQAESSSKVSLEQQKSELDFALQQLEMLSDELKKIAEKRAKLMVESHSRFKKLLGTRRFEAVYPVLPPDVMGVYVLLPVPKSL